MQEFNAFEEKYKANLQACFTKDEAQKEFSNVKLIYDDCERAKKSLETKKTLHETELVNLAKSKQKNIDTRDALKKVLAEKLAPFGYENLEDLCFKQLKDSLSKRLLLWKKQQDEVQQHESKYTNIQNALLADTIRLEQETKTLKELAANFSVIEKDVIKLSAERKALYSDKCPEVEEASLKKNLAQSQATFELCKTACNAALQQKENNQLSYDKLLHSIASRDQSLKVLEERFFEKITSYGFQDLACYKEALMPQEQREELLNLKQKLENEKSQALALKEHSKRCYEELAAKALTDESIDSITEKMALLTAKKEEVHERLVSISCTLSDNAARKEESKGLKETLDKQLKEKNLWGALSELIGSSDGKKFRNIAQKMTLNMMIAHANRQLHKMNDRYLLKQSDKADLELEVIDNYQGSEERPVKNLSGGESFIVSLALALGLSQMASKKIKVDTLFLDEGFGTLDEKSLDIALDALTQLQMTGKTIGIISHVEALKNNIPTKIAMRPLPGGKSRIEGPGVCFLG